MLLTTVQLHAQRSIGGFGPNQFHRFAGPSQQAARIEQSGTGCSDAAQRADHQPKGQIAVPRHRREQQVCSQSNGSKLQHGAHTILPSLVPVRIPSSLQEGLSV